ncbi:MAG: hypothetical protein ACC645_00780 [Pirellulales bacterium]
MSAFVVLLCLVGLIGKSSAQQAPPVVQPDATLSPKEEALRWLDRFAGQQILFSGKEIDRIRRKLTKSTPAQARQWLAETRDLRAALDRPQWQQTRVWLKQFAQREAARQAASRAAAQRPRQPPQVARQAPQKRQPPLIDSLDVARWSVMRSLYPRW